MSQEEQHSQEKRSEEDQPETLDFLKDQLEAAETGHFSFGKEDKNEANDKAEDDSSSNEVMELAAENQPKAEAAVSELKTAEQPSAEQNGVHKQATSPVPKTEQAGKALQPVQQPPHKTESEQIAPKEQPKVEQNAASRTIVENVARPVDPVISPQRQPKKPELQDLIEGKMLVQSVSEQRAPKQSEPKSKPDRLKTQPAATKQPVLSKVDDLRHLAKTHFQRKRQTYGKLKEWDEQRAEQLAMHRAVVEDLQASIDRSVKSSLDNLQIYISFLRQKSKQLEKYAAHPAINTRNITQSNEASRGIYINCALLLNSLSDENAQRCKKAQTLSQHIRKNILTDNLEEHLKRTQLQLMKIRQKISTLKASLQKCNAETEQRTVRLATQFNQDQNNVSLQTDRDFFKSQLSFLRKAYEQTRVQKRLGQLTYQYLRTAIEEQHRRSESISKAIMQYVEGLRTSCDVEIDEQSLQQLRKHQQKKLIPEFYAVEELLDGKLLRLVKQRIKLDDEEFDADMLKQFLDRLCFAEFDSSLLKVRQFGVSHEITRGKIEAGTLLVTVDNFLLLFLESENTQPFSKPAVLFKIDKTLVVTAKSDLLVQLKKKEQKKGMMSYLIWDTKTQPTFSVKFRTPQEKGEFEALLRRLL